MPIYEYRCGGCRKKFERIVLSASAKGHLVCPKCGHEGAERLVSRFATASKGESEDFGGMGGDFDGGGEGDSSGDFGEGGDEGFGDDDLGGMGEADDL